MKNLRALISPDKFNGSLNANADAQALRAGRLPIADGGLRLGFISVCAMPADFY
jgi:hypothetical protein